MAELSAFTTVNNRAARQLPAAFWDGPSKIDHAEQLRNRSDLDALWRDPAAKLLGIASSGESGGLAAAERCTGELTDEIVFLGLVADRPWFATRQSAAAGISAKSEDADDLSRELLTKAQAVLNWREDCSHCPACGGALESIRGGFSSRCLDCGRQHFPRTDPAVIVAVLNDHDELYLAHQSSWPTGRMSLLAGFVEAGESFEAACHREIAEEASLSLAALRYVGSQPWPFPRSVMVAFVARSAGGIAGSGHSGRVDGIELDFGRFFTRSEVADAIAAGEVSVPTGGSISARLISAWRDEQLPSPDRI